MVVNDILYGATDFEDAVFEKLLQSPTVLRLKDITQAGIPAQYNQKPTYSRYEHSIGVSMLLKKLGASVEEQVAGLLHDISHLAFSHVAEWVFEEGGSMKEGFNETLTEKFVMESELKAILEEAGFDPIKICDLHNFSILKAGLPDVNADRIDYSLRDIFVIKDAKISFQIIKHLEMIDQRIIVNDFEAAVLFGREFLKLQTEYWGGFDSVFRYHVFSQLLKLLVEQGELKFEEFMGGEGPIMKKIQSSTHEKVKESLEMLSYNDTTQFKGKYGVTIKKKFRYIDPWVKKDGKLTRLSELDVEFRDLLEKAKGESRIGIAI